MSTLPLTFYQLEVFMQGRKWGEEDYGEEVEKEKCVMESCFYMKCTGQNTCMISRSSPQYYREMCDYKF